MILGVLPAAVSGTVVGPATLAIGLTESGRVVSREESDSIGETAEAGFRGVGNRIGVTATTRAVRSSAIESLLSI